MAAQSTAKQVLLYQNTVTKPLFFLFITVASGIQYTFWSYLALEAFKDYQQKPPEKHSDKQKEEAESGSTQGTAKRALFESIKEKASSGKWRLGVTLLALTFGSLFAFTSVIYPRRTINKVMYSHSKQALEITTYTPLGGLTSKEVPCLSVWRKGSAQSSHVSLKVKGDIFYYLLGEKNGKFHNPKMFDMIIGTRR
ncbi:PREDICTED: transmembrane protein 223-like [Amphimedon queenslandica]|uniref:Transmembrane protein 223 n=1 Tax=Amphimedon queenslandica TaxID=400682 RepID=A0A1X7V502_AMPQE|nr:PREDICTED: transmembrane protein 223-like [Amphimedon queenslandica]|eukprot:XP_003385675.1 PREDICTED: transmembrane protein 223-like [Amphimedon queenslandica]